MSLPRNKSSPKTNVTKMRGQRWEQECGVEGCLLSEIYFF